MAKASQAQEQTMEEILASIRRIISDDEARGSTKAAAPPREAAPRPTSNVSHLFAVSPTPAEAVDNVVELPLDPPPREELPMITEAFAQAMESRPVESFEPPAAPFPQPRETFAPPRLAPLAPRATPRPAALREPRSVERRLPAVDTAPTQDRRTTAPLLSPRTDAAVQAAFTELTDSLFSDGGRGVDALAEDLLRPMLKSWLDNNLPTLVERPVREEIERVSRGGRR
jgi:cell pole-organizing protein PopZ